MFAKGLINCLFRQIINFISLNSISKFVYRNFDVISNESLAHIVGKVKLQWDDNREIDCVLKPQADWTLCYLAVCCFSLYKRVIFANFLKKGGMLWKAKQKLILTC